MLEVQNTQPSDHSEPDARILQLDHQLCFAIYSTSRAITNLYRPHLKKLNLTYPGYLVMLVLWEHGEVGLGEIGRRLYLDSGTLTPLLKRLETKGLLRRTRSTSDERQVLVGLTKKGDALRHKARAIPQILKCSLDLPAGKAAALGGEIRAIFQLLANQEESR